MSDTAEATAKPSGEEQELSGGAYEVIRKRLVGHAEELGSAVDQINEQRIKQFGSIKTEILATDRILTEHNCVARDLVALGDCLVFGYDVHIGLRKTYKVSDTFSVFKVVGERLEPTDGGLLSDPQFEKDYGDLLNFYKEARFKTFFKTTTSLLMVFQTSKSHADIKAFKWHINNDNTLTYEHNRADREYVRPAQQEFSWTPTTRDDFVHGSHPHVSIEDKVFVECIGGDLTIKLEDNTDSGLGIYAEPVEHRDQTLDDGQIHYAIHGSIVLLKVLPFQEEEWRYFIVNTKAGKAHRVDELAQAALLLPDNDGLIFPNGYYLATGELKRFPFSAENCRFRSLRESAHGEDFLYSFFNPAKGEFTLLQYNVIEKDIANPVRCHGYAVYSDGRMLTVTAKDEPQKSHAMQWWQTPFKVAHLSVAPENNDGMGRIGNKAVVQAMADMRQLVRFATRDSIYLGLYNDIVRLAGEIQDRHFWLNEPFAFKSQLLVEKVEKTAKSAVDEFEKVVQIREHTAKTTDEVTASFKATIDEVRTLPFDTVEHFIASMTRLNLDLGKIISLRDLRYVDQDRVSELESEAQQKADEIRRDCVGFLLTEGALKPYFTKIDEMATLIEGAERVKDFESFAQTYDDLLAHIETLTDLVNSLDAEDASDAAAIIEKVSELIGRANQVKARHKQRRTELLKAELDDEYHAQFKLLNQSVPGYLEQAETPDKCEEYLAKVMLNLEDLEGRFAEFPEYLEQLTEKREEIYSAFQSKRATLEEARSRRVQALSSSAKRILQGVENRVNSMSDVNEINAYFAADPMPKKVRAIIADLVELQANVESEEIAAQLKNLQQEGTRQVKDRAELFADGQDVINLGGIKFLVSKQDLDLSLVFKEGAAYFHLNGTHFYEPVEHAELQSMRDLWDQYLPSETTEVARSEYLAYLTMQAILSQSIEGMPKASEIHLKEKRPALIKAVQAVMSDRYDEGYEKGIHDADAAAITAQVLPALNRIGLLRFHPDGRALGNLFHMFYGGSQAQQRLVSKIQSYGALRQTSAVPPVHAHYLAELSTLVEHFIADRALPTPPDGHLWNVRQAASYLFECFADDTTELPLSAAGKAIKDEFRRSLTGSRSLKLFKETLERCAGDLNSMLAVTFDWLAAADIADDSAPFALEAAVAIMADHSQQSAKWATPKAKLSLVVEGLRSSHRRIAGDQLPVDLFDFNQRLEQHDLAHVPQYRKFQQIKHELVVARKAELRLDELTPRILSSFVRNKLINDVYLPKIGANLAKQMGAYGDDKRTDLMGLLLLISPPGYGKTTLMEYIADRLGLIFMKINGPALGHDVKSLDPAEAPNATARAEVEKLNLAFEMGNNVMVYVDDIQHCHAEFLQKFISLCDGQRKIEGVHGGVPRTYDLRGRRIAVVMAGNPYNESGERFQVPDMLANRADIYNLGDMLGGHEQAFELSYIENSLTSHPTLNRLATRSQTDVYALVKAAQKNSIEGLDLEGQYSSEEINEFVAILGKLLDVQKTVLAVNQQYILSASQDDSFRTEPKFLLQGSYRNINKIVANVEAVMTAEEVDQVVMDHYRFEAQLLTSGSEFNLLRFKEMSEQLSPEETQRLEDIREDYRRGKRLGGSDSDPMLKIVSQLDDFNTAFGKLLHIAKKSA